MGSRRMHRTAASSVIFLHLYLLAGLALLVGGLLYLAYRPTTLYLFEWVEAIKFGSCVDGLRLFVREHNLTLPAALIYSVPHGLWTYAFLLALTPIWVHGLNNLFMSRVWLSLPLVVSVLPEILQATPFFPGTFDWTDLTVNVTGFLAGVATISLKYRKIQHENLT